MKIANFDKRNRFSYRYDNLLTCKMGKLIPFDVIPVLPGDVWKIRGIPMARMMALLSPAFGEVVVRLHEFYVPTRIIWPHFYEGFMIPKENDDGSLTTSAIPTISKTWTEGSLGDYLGYPVGVPFTSTAFKVRAYQKVVRDWFMNLNIEDVADVPLSLEDGEDTTTSTELFNVNWVKDRFTGSFPEKQRGPEIRLPIGSSAPVISTAGALQTGISVNTFEQNSLSLKVQAVNTQNPNVVYAQGGNVTSVTGIKSINGLQADLTTAVGIDLDQFRLAWQMNKKLIMDMRGGSRTPEWLLTHYGVRCSDARLQRSEFLGGSKSYFNVSEVLQTSATDSTSPQGNMSGHGFSVFSTPSRTKTFEEHGYIVRVLSIVPKAVYSQGAPRDDLKRSPEEFGLPVLSHTIMDAVYKGEVMWTGTDTDKQPLGYRNIYDEYRQMYSRLAGQFRSSLDYWTWARKFASQPVLNKNFIQVEQIDRPFATEDTDHFLVCVKTVARAYRPLPKRGDRGLIDHQ
nr:major head protein [Microvirus sp.]